MNELILLDILLNRDGFIWWAAAIGTGMTALAVLGMAAAVLLVRGGR